MKVYVVNECEPWSEYGDLICVAVSIPKAIQFLVKYGWLRDDTDVASWETKTLEEELGSEWQTKLEQMTFRQLNNLVKGLLFQELELIE